MVGGFFAILLVGSVCTLEAQEHHENNIVENMEDRTESGDVDETTQRPARLNNILVWGIGHRDHEDIMEIVKAIGERLGIEEPLKEVVSAYRYYSNRTPRPICVRMVNNAAKGKWIIMYRKSRLWKDKIYLEEHLTKNVQLLSGQTRIWAKNKHYAHTWTWNSRVYYRKNYNDPTKYRVLNIRHLLRLQTNEKLAEMVERRLDNRTKRNNTHNTINNTHNTTNNTHNTTNNTHNTTNNTHNTTNNTHNTTNNTHNTTNNTHNTTNNTHNTTNNTHNTTNNTHNS
uniref:Uncharacterized protein PFB0460c n=1 Tax=Cacopsylla melanoneura TaxID=428564 RepID=A0A8D9AZX8_9HEMI